MIIQIQWVKAQFRIFDYNVLLTAGTVLVRVSLYPQFFIARVLTTHTETVSLQQEINKWTSSHQLLPLMNITSIIPHVMEIENV